MKNFTLILAFLLAGITASANSAKTNAVPFNYGEAFIFIEGGVEFAVYPNGEFDFYYNPNFITNSIINIPHPNRNISYNAGYDYNAYVQFDDFGAVIQIENVPVYYDYYGRIIQAGNIPLQYDNKGRVARVGGMTIRYNRFNQPIRYVGYINHFNSRYVSRPWHSYYMRPHVNYRIVYYEPYRAYYQPVRMDYHYYYNNYYQTNNNYYSKNNFYRPGQQVASYNYGRKTTTEREIKPELRSNENVSRAAPLKSTATVRSNNNVTTSDVNNRSYSVSNSSRERINLEQHNAAVNAQRGRESLSNNTNSNTANSRGAVSNSSTVRSNIPVESAKTVNTETRNSTANTVQRRTAEKPAAVTRTSAPVQSSVRTNNSAPTRSTNVQRATNNTNRSSVRTQSATPRAQAVRSTTSEVSSSRGSRGRG